MKLDTALLKQTEGLLSSIDTVLSTTTNAERVDRLVESAAPSLYGVIFDDVDDWDAFQAEVGLGHFPSYLDYNGRHTTDCGCPYADAKATHMEGVGEYPWQEYNIVTTTFRVQLCETDENGWYIGGNKIEPLSTSPWQDSHHAADFACGAAGCACTEIFATDTCAYCGTNVSVDKGAWPHDDPVVVDATGGDACDASPDGVHDVEE